ncbi:homeodomain-interacting protein kinase 3-like [Vanacampus margaritifer]
MAAEQNPPYRVQAKAVTSSEEEAVAMCSSLCNADGYLWVLHSPASDYHILGFLGEGTYGDVVKCLKTATREEVAVKIFKHINDPGMFEKEASTLKTLMAFDMDKVNLVQCKSIFVDRLYMCLEFEILDINLWDFMHTRPTKCLLVKEIRPILHQLAVGLHFLNSIGLIHADLKPNNIMMVEHVNRPYKVKIIDFGLAQHVSETNQGQLFQNRRYRAPEIILGCPYTKPIDVWSLGCIIAELFLGSALFYSTCEYDMLRKIEHILGHIPQRLLNIGLNTTRYYFYEMKKGYQSFYWRLKTPNEFGYVCTDCFINSLDDLCKVRQVVHLSNEDTTAEVQDQETFVDLLKKLLRPDAGQRLIPGQILQDPFVTMADLALNHGNSFYMKLSCEMMQACQNPNSGTQVGAAPASHRGNVSARPTWQIEREHPDILGISSRISRGLNLDNLDLDPHKTLSHRLRSVCLRTSSPLENMWHMEGEPQQQEDQESVQKQRGACTVMTGRAAKLVLPMQNSNQLSQSTKRDGRQDTIHNGEPTRTEIAKMFTESAATSMTNVESLTARSINNMGGKWKTKPGDIHRQKGKKSLKRRWCSFRPTPISKRDSPITKKRKMNPKDVQTPESSNEADTSAGKRTQLTAKTTEANGKTESDGDPAKSKTTKRKKTRNTYSAWRRRNKAARKLKANTGNKNKPMTTNRSGVDTDNGKKKKDESDAKKMKDKT